jgi:hypothetical protein
MATRVVPVCAPAWWEDPKVLVTDSWITQWKRRNTGRPLCFSERINALTRTALVILVVAVLFSLYNQDFMTTLLYSVILGLFITLPDIIDTVKASFIQESFVVRASPLDQPKVALAPPVPTDQTNDSPNQTLPSPRNPFMNVLIDEIKYKPDRPEASPIDEPYIKETLDEYFRVQWFSDPTDVFGKSQSQRQFYTVPSTTIPNDRESYQNWLYKIPGKTCKEGGREACVDGTAGAALPWLNINP